MHTYDYTFVIICRTPYFVSTLSIFSEIQISLTGFAGFFYCKITLLKDRFVKKMLLKRAKTRRHFFAKP